MIKLKIDEKLIICLLPMVTIMMLATALESFLDGHTVLAVSSVVCFVVLVFMSVVIVGSILEVKKNENEDSLP